MSARHQESGGEAVRAIVRSILEEPVIRHLGKAELPRPESVGELVALLREVAFPGFFGRRGLTEETLEWHVSALVERVRAHAAEQIRGALTYFRDAKIGGGAGSSGTARRVNGSDAECEREAQRLAGEFIAAIPGIRSMLALDVQAAYDGDPAATHPDETIFCYPGVDAVFAHRVAHAMHRLGAPLLPRLIAEQAHSRTGIDIHPGARIGRSFFIDHGAGVVVGETAVIGEHVKIYQGVTLGAKSFRKDERGRIIRDEKRHPTIGDRVTIYAGAVILGGDTVIGDDCVIGGGVFVTESVPARTVVRQKAAELERREIKG